MKKQFACSIVTIAVLAAGSIPAKALDEVYRKSTDTAAKGTITEVTKTSITVKKSIGAPVTVPANDITEVRWNGEPAKLKLSRSDEAGGRLEKALAGYKEGLTDPKTKGNGKTDVEFLIARATAKLALADSTKLDDAIKALSAFSKANADNFRYFESMSYLGEMYMAKGDFDQAKTTFNAISTSPWADYKMAAQSANARIMLKQNDVAGALAAFDAVISGSAAAKEPAILSRRFEALLGRATCLTTQKQYDAAVKALDDVVTQADAGDTHTQAEAYVRQGDCYQALGRSKEAVLAYLHVPVLFPKENALHAEALYNLSRLWSTVGKPERGIDARAVLESEYADSKWAKMLAGAAGS